MANKYVTANNKLVVVDGKLLQVSGDNVDDELLNLIDTQTTSLGTTELSVSELDTLIDNHIVDGVTLDSSALLIDSPSNNSVEIKDIRVSNIDVAFITVNTTNGYIDLYGSGNDVTLYQDTTLTYESGNITTDNLVAENIKKDVNILGVVGTHEGGGSLNVAYSLTPPTDTSKIWLQCAEPSGVEVQNYLNSVTSGEFTYLKNNYTSIISSVLSLFKYSDTEIGALHNDKKLRTYDINTGEVTRELSFTPTYTLLRSCYRLDNYLYYTSYSNAYIYLEKLNLTTLETSVLIKITDDNMYSYYMFMRENDNDNLYICTDYPNRGWYYYIYKYSISNNTYTKLIEKSGSSAYWYLLDKYTQCYYNGCLYAFCITNNSTYNKAYKFNLDTGEATQLTNVEALSSLTTTNGITSTEYASSFVFDNFMYIVGCNDSRNKKDRIIRINLATDEAEITNEYLLGSGSGYNSSIAIDNIAYIFRTVSTDGGNLYTIQKYTYKQTLEQNKSVITTDTLFNNNVNLIISDKLNLSVNLHNAYLGNANNLAEKVNAYYYNGSKWVGINCDDYREE